MRILGGLRKLARVALGIEPWDCFPDCRFEEKVAIAKECELYQSVFKKYSNVAHHASVMNCTIGERTSVGRYSKLRDTDIGKFCSISWDVTIGAVSHPMTRVSSHAFTYRKQFGIAAQDTMLPQLRTTIGNDVWIGCNSVIVSGVSVGDGAIIGAGAVVTKDVPAYSVVAGVPAQVKRMRFSEESINVLKDAEWWNWDDNQLQQHLELFSKDVDDELLKQLQLLKEEKSDETGSAFRRV